MIQTLETERLILRPFTVDDAEAYYQLYWQIADQAPEEHPSLDDLHAENVHYLSYANYSALKSFGRWLVILKNAGAVIGTCLLIPHRFEAEQIAECNGLISGFEVIVGWAFAAQYRRKGYATEAARAIIAYGLQTLHLQRIVAWTSRDNLPSFGVMQKLGMTFIQRDDAQEVFAVIEAHK